MTVSEDDLNAFLDGQLDPAREAEVVAWLDERPDAREALRDYAEHKLLIRAEADRLARDLPVRASTDRLAHSLETALLRRRARPVWLQRIAAAVLLVVAGWSAHEFQRGAAAEKLPDLVVEAAGAHMVLAGLGDRILDLPENTGTEVAGWITSSFGRPVHIPRLEAAGLHLVGGSLLNSVAGPIASLVYRNDAGHRLTLCLSPRDEDGADDLHVAEVGGMQVGWWSDGDQSYALVAEAAEPELVAIVAGLGTPSAGTGLAGTGLAGRH